MNRTEQPDNATGLPDGPPDRHARIQPRRSDEQDLDDTVQRKAGQSPQASALASGTDAAPTTSPLARGSAPTGAPAATTEPPWPAVAAIVAGILPSKASRRTPHLGPLGAWLVHVAAAAMTAASAILVMTWADGVGPVRFLTTTVVKPYYRAPGLFIGSLLGWAVAIEVGFLVAGLRATIWGALPDEPIGRSWRWGLTRAWLWTGQVFWAVLLIGISGGFRGVHTTANPERPLASYLYLEEAELIGGLARETGMIWLFWGLLRRAGARRCAESFARTPRCEACGYSLVSIPFEARCPECGQPAAISLDPQAQPGTVWERRRELGRAAAYVKTARTAISSPRRPARCLRLGADPRHAHLFLFVNPGMTPWGI